VNRCVREMNMVQHTYLEFEAALDEQNDAVVRNCVFAYVFVLIRRKSIAKALKIRAVKTN
jgi:hypothetical protein